MSADRKCGGCGESPAVMLEMAPGRDGAPWWLCGPCWRMGSPSTPQRKEARS